MLVFTHIQCTDAHTHAHVCTHTHTHTPAPEGAEKALDLGPRAPFLTGTVTAHLLIRVGEPGKL